MQSMPSNVCKFSCNRGTCGQSQKRKWAKAIKWKKRQICIKGILFINSIKNFNVVTKTRENIYWRYNRNSLEKTDGLIGRWISSKSVWVPTDFFLGFGSPSPMTLTISRTFILKPITVDAEVTSFIIFKCLK